MSSKQCFTTRTSENPLPWISLAFLSGCLWAATGCSNPADNVAEAQTGEAEPVPSAASPAATADTSAPAVPAAGARVYTIAPESTIGFVGSKVTGSHEGGFKTFTGTFTAADGQLAPVQTIQIDMNSLWADSDRLAGHLKNEDFFDVGKFPTATFTSTSIAKSDSGHTVTGNLNLHGVTKSISFPATIAVTDSQVTVKAEFFIRRFDFGIVYKGRADDLIRDEVVIKLDVVAKAG